MEIFYIDISKVNIEQSVLKQYLHDRKFSDEFKEKQHCYGRFLVKTAAEKFFNLDNVEIEIVNKKPRFVHNKLNFSISHCENIVVVAFDKNPIGADIEIMKERNFKELFKRYNYSENASKEVFYKFWTQYEAGIKLQGTPKSKITIPFLDNFMLSVVGNFEDDFTVYEFVQDGFVKQNLSR